MKEAVRAFLRSGRGDEAAFDSLALELYRWQRANNADYDAICGRVTVAGWRDIPAVPVALFQDLPLCCFPPEQARLVFRTSGTTVGRRGEHRLLDAELYELGARLHAEAVVGAIPAQGVALVPQAADSSLGHMCRSFAPDLGWFFSIEAGVDVAGARAALRAATLPQFLPATAFAMAELLEGLDAPLRLPEGSLVMVTGGYKGRTRAIPEDALVGAAHDAFPGARVVGEYGMTELSSQLWAAPLGTPFRPPPWMRVRAVDPLTRAPATRGLLCFVDLANHQTVLAIETQDVGEVLPDGRVALQGRLGGAPARGCSLTVEEAARGPGSGA